MTRPALVPLALLATSAAAEPTHVWGLSASDAGPCVVTLALCDRADCYAEVTFENRLIWAGVDSHITQRLEIDGLAVTVEVIQHDGDRPDYFTVLPPAGFAAVPDHLMVGDDDSGVIQIRLEPLS